MPSIRLSEPAVLAFVVLPFLLAAAFVIAVWFAWKREHTSQRAARAAGLALFMTGTWMVTAWQLAASGVLRNWSATPPPFALLVVTILLLAFRLGLGSAGRQIARAVPLWMLVGVQGFRLPLELAMHRMYERGIMPVQMSYSGLNYDILTGISALIVAALLLSGSGRYAAGPPVERDRADSSDQRRRRGDPGDSTHPVFRRRRLNTCGHVHAVRLAAGGHGPCGAGRTPDDLPRTGRAGRQHAPGSSLG